MQMFIAGLLILPKGWKQAKYPLTESINKLVHLYAGQLFSNKKERTTDSFNMMNLEWIMLKKSDSKGSIFYSSLFITI